MAKNSNDGKFVVVQGGQRLTDLLPNEQAAIQEANRLRKIQEDQQGQASQKVQPPVEVKQNLFG
jgi:hypothetical protein